MSSSSETCLKADQISFLYLLQKFKEFTDDFLKRNSETKEKEIKKKSIEKCRIVSV